MNRKMKLKKTVWKKIVTVILAAGMVASMTACQSGGRESSGTETTDVRIAYFPNITHTQALVLKNQRTLENKWKDKVKDILAKATLLRSPGDKTSTFLKISSPENKKLPNILLIS